MKYLLTSLFSFFIIFQSIGQDAILYQFQNALPTLSPTYVGTSCNARLTANYQNQWNTVLQDNSFHTTALNFDIPIRLKNDDRIGLGLQTFYQQAGESHFRTATIAIAANYQKRILKTKTANHYLIGALEYGITNTSIDFLNLRYGSQHNGNGQFDPTLPTNETFDRDNFNSKDLAAGLAWRSEFSEHSNLHIGFNMFHLNRANQSFSSNNFEQLYIRYAVHGIYSFHVGEKVILSPRMVYTTQGPADMLLLGTNVSILLGNESQHRLSFGATIRAATNFNSKGLKKNAQMVNLSYETKKITLGVNAVLDTSPIIAASNGFGGFDVAVGYRFCK